MDPLPTQREGATSHIYPLDPCCASCEIYMDFHLLKLQCLHCCNALRGLYSVSEYCWGWIWENEMAYGNQICTTHAQNLLFPSFRSKFWHHRWIRRPPFPIWYVYFGDRWIFTMWPWPLTFWPWTCVTCCGLFLPSFTKSTNPFLTYNVFTADNTLRHAMKWTFVVYWLSVIKLCTKFERNRTIHSWVFEDSTNVQGSVFRGIIVPPVWRRPCTFVKFGE